MLVVLACRWSSNIISQGEIDICLVLLLYWIVLIIYLWTTTLYIRPRSRRQGRTARKPPRWWTMSCLYFPAWKPATGQPATNYYLSVLWRIKQSVYILKLGNWIKKEWMKSLGQPSEENHTILQDYTEWVNEESGTAHCEESRSVSQVYTYWTNEESKTAQRGEPHSFARLHRVNEWRVWDNPVRRTTLFCKFTHQIEFGKGNENTCLLLVLTGVHVDALDSGLKPTTIDARSRSLPYPCQYIRSPWTYSKSIEINTVNIAACNFDQPQSIKEG